MFRKTLTALVTLTALGGCTRPAHSDVEAVAEHHIRRHQGDCASWLYSFRTQFKYCASPVIDVEVEVAPTLKKAVPEGEETLADLTARGEEVYGNVCAACHQANGQGVPGAFPPLAGSSAFYGDAKNMANIIVNGLSGEIEVQGQKFNGAMPPQGHLSDYEIAAAATYVRNSWGNNDGIVTKADVQAAR